MRDGRWEFNQAAFNDWLVKMQNSYALVAHEQYPFPVFHKDRKYKHTCYVDLYEFVPKSDAEAGRRIRTAFNERNLK